MNIAQIQTLDDGMSNISCSGVVTYTQNPEQKSGVSNGQPWSFWTQFVVLKDATGDMGVNLNLGNDETGVFKNQQIAIEKGILGSYAKDGKTRKSLRARLVQPQTPPQGQQAPQQPPQATKEDKPDWSAISQGKVRHGVVCSYIQAGQEPALSDVEYWVEYIMTGQAPPPPNSGTQREAGQDDEPPPPDDSDIPLY